MTPTPHNPMLVSAGVISGRIILPRRTKSSSRAASPSTPPALARSRQSSPARSSPRTASPITKMTTSAGASCQHRMPTPRAVPPPAHPLLLPARLMTRASFFVSSCFKFREGVTSWPEVRLGATVPDTGQQGLPALRRGAELVFVY